MRRRILIVASWYPSGASRQGSFVHAQVRALAGAHDVAVVAPVRRRFRHRLSLRPARSGAWALEDGIPISRPVVTPPLPWARGPALDAYAEAVWRAYHALEPSWGRPDLVHAHVAIPGGWAGATLARRLGVPLVLTEHSAPFDMNLGAAADRRRTREALLVSSQVLAVGRRLEREILAFEPRAAVTVVGNVIDTDFWSPTPASDAERRPCADSLRIVTVGALAAQKGMDVLLQAVAAIRRAGNGPRLELVIVGDGPDRDALQAQAERLGIADACGFIGSADPEAVRDRLRWADLFVSASRWETFSVATAEAIATGVPVVVTESGGPEQFVTPAAGRTVPPEAPEELARAIVEVGCRHVEVDPRQAREELVSRFSVPAFLRELERVYAAAAPPSAGGSHA